MQLSPIHLVVLACATSWLSGCAARAPQVPSDPSAAAAEYRPPQAGGGTPAVLALHRDGGETAPGQQDLLVASPASASEAPAAAKQPPARNQPLATNKPGASRPPRVSLVSTSSAASTASVLQGLEDSRGLTSAEAQCAAARHAPLAGALERRRYEIEQIGQKRRKLASPAALASALLACQSLKERNDAAERALIAFYGLAELQHQRTVVAKTRSQWNQAWETLREVRDRGLTVDADPTDLERQELEIQRQEAELAATERRMGIALNLLMGRTRHDPAPTVEASLAADQTPVDVESAVVDGLSCRADLGQLRVLCSCLDGDNLETAKALMALLEPTLGAVLKSNCECLSCLQCLLPNCNEACELSALRRQLARLYQAASERAEGEISAAAILVNQRIKTLSIAQSKLSSWRQRVEQLEALVQVESKRFAELTEARFEALTAEAAVIHEMAQLDVARVKLRAAQGMLARQCGCGACCDRTCNVAPIHQPRSTPVRVEQSQQAPPSPPRLINAVEGRPADEPTPAVPESIQVPSVRVASASSAPLRQTSFTEVASQPQWAPVFVAPERLEALDGSPSPR